MSSHSPDNLDALNRLRSLFAAVPDSRQAGKIRYPLDVVLMMALCAMLCPADVKRLAELVRGHRSIENRCHRVLDVVFGEDHCQVRDPNAARNLSILREAVLKTLRANTSKGSLVSKRKRASLDPAFRLTLLLGLQA